MAVGVVFRDKWLATPISVFAKGAHIREYVYLFKVGEEEYYIYSCSKAEAVAQYLEEKSLIELPKGCIITRSNI